VAAICAVLAYLWFAGYVTETKPNRRLSQKGRRYTRQGRTPARPSCGSTCAGGVAVDVMAVYRPGLQSSGIPPYSPASLRGASAARGGLSGMRLRECLSR
jgi:hypothetical protein